MDVTVWEKKIHSGFPYIMGESGPIIDCDTANNYYTAHLSHHATQEAYNSHLYPMEGVTIENFADK